MGGSSRTQAALPTSAWGLGLAKQGTLCNGLLDRGRPVEGSGRHVGAQRLDLTLGIRFS